jgi:hypothetical protein
MLASTAQSGRPSDKRAFGAHLLLLLFGSVWMQSIFKESFTCVPLKKFIITHKPLKKLTVHRCHCSKLLCFTNHSARVLFVFRRLVALMGGTGH